MNITSKISALILASIMLPGCMEKHSNALLIREQGAFSAGGTVITGEGVFDPLKPWFEQQGGQTRHGDHADVFYQIPANARQLSMVFLHGYGQSRRSWQTTADGREGFADIFLRKGYSVYLADQPGRGDAGQTTKPATIPATPDDQTWFTQFRIGLYPEFNGGVQFPKDAQSLDRFFRMMTPNTGNVDEATIVGAMSAVFDRSGEGILLTHSAGGAPGWKTAIRNDRVKAIVAIEPGGFCFPEGETPEGNRGGAGIPLDEFMKLTEIPIIVYFGDYIPKEETAAFSQNFRRSVLATARQWATVVNAHGGDVTVVHLPETGIKGNTHFIMSDLNNLEIAAHLEKWLKKKGLDSNSNSTDMDTQKDIFPKGEKIANSNFSGTAWLQMLVTSAETFDCTVGNVTFERGVRNSWHSHPGGQILLCTSGKGYYQEKGKPVRLLQAGDVVEILPNVVHWHGATPDSEFTHIAIGTATGKGAAVWLEPVTDEEYNSCSAAD
jgi:quercetin dioxygenase-like cupin family protein/pimeloyl-ACP methyl ester carboxylesterase